MITFHVEHWREFEREANWIFPIHWKDVGLDHQRVQLSMDNPKYEQLDDLGLLHVVVVRSDGEIVGYYMAFMMVHPHYKDAGLMAVTDVYYLLPEFRTGGTGARLFAFVESSMKERGVTKAYLSCKIHQDHSELFVKMGWKPTDITFTKHLGS